MQVPAGQGYTKTAKLLHWLTVLAVFVLIPVGVVMTERAGRNVFDALTNRLYDSHKLIGFILLWLMALRILYKLRHPAPPPVPSLTRMERIASASVHHLLYVLLVLVPLLGWAGVSSFGATSIGGLFSLPSILPVNQDLAKTILKIHGALAMLLAALVMAHIGAALMHGVIKRDGVMNRMLGWWPIPRKS